MLASLWNEARYCVRCLSRSPGFTLAAVITIALGIGVNTGIFSVLNGFLFRDVPAPDPHELVSMLETVEGAERTGRSGEGTFTIAEYRSYRDRAESLDGLLALANPNETTLGGETARVVFGAIVSCNYFDVLEQIPVLGRGLTSRDCLIGADPVVVLGYDIWTGVFGSDPAILGQTVDLDRNLFTVVGVAAPDTYAGSPLQTGYFAPLSADGLLNRGRHLDERFHWLYLTGRRAEGTSLEQVRAEFNLIAASIDQAEPGRATTLTIERSVSQTLPGDFRNLGLAAGSVLMVAFGLILLVACANVANLLLARGTGRSREIGIRLSLGASRARIARQLLTESLLIAIAGGLLGSLLSLSTFQVLFKKAFAGLVPPELPGVVLNVDLSPDSRVLAISIGVTLATGFIFGLLPAILLSKQNLSTVVKQDASGSSGSKSGGRLRGTLVGIQVAVSMVLMIATGLLLRGLYATYTIDPGFNYQDVVHLSFGTDGSPDIFDQGVMEEISGLPGVDAVAFSTQTPLGEARMGTPLRLPGESDSETRLAELDLVTPGYFSLLEIPITRGRTFTETESFDATGNGGNRPVIINESTARNLWGNRDPIGQTLIVRGGVTARVIGVAADAQLNTLGSVDPYLVIEPRAPGGELLVRSRADLATTAAGIRDIIQSRDASLAFRVLPLETNIAWWRSVSTTVTGLGGALGVLALMLAAVGIYGIVAYAVTRRYREIGIRMALGAGSGTVLGLMLRRTMRPVVIGAAIGLAAAIAVSRVLSLVLFGVSPADAVGLGGSALVVLGVALVAGFLATRPATIVEPTSVLRYE